MCGISGIVRFGNPSTVETIKAMNDVIIHRGPDDEGFYCLDSNGLQLLLASEDNLTQQDIYTISLSSLADDLNRPIKLALGHRRLSIVDLSPLGHQPLSIDNGNYWISYNGEVYNHLEIRKELEALNHSFISQCDTEVILAAYKEWGEECLARFNGMFAFLIYDKLKQQLFIARDRFGVKPLYYYQDTDGIYFASEIKQFTVLPQWNAKLNHQRAFDFLAYGLTDHTRDTLFANVYQLRGGECALIDLNSLSSLKEQGLTVKRWYQLADTVTTYDYSKATQQFKDIFVNSISLRLRADVDIGSCLSGGLDSSAIVSVAATQQKQQLNNKQIKTFSACSEHKEFDETEYIHEVVRQTKAQPFYCYPEMNDLFAKMEAITWHQDEPFASTSIYAQWQVFELSKNQKIKVMLDGQGADEQLAGYHGLYFQTLLNQTLHQGRIFKFIKELCALRKMHQFNIKSGISKAILSFFPNGLKMLIGKLLGKQSYQLNWINFSQLKCIRADPFIKSGMNQKNIKQSLYSQITQSNLPMLLHWEDRDSMAHSIESRVPFLDYRLVEFIYSLPDDYKIEDGITKKVLRDALTNILPDKIKNRVSKLGFVTPEQIWIQDHPEQFKKYLEDAIDYSQGILNHEQVLSIFDDVVNGKLKFDFWLWRVINFGLWMKLFKVEV